MGRGGGITGHIDYRAASHRHHIRVTAQVGLVDGPVDQGYRGCLILYPLSPRHQQRGPGELRLVRMIPQVIGDFLQQVRMVPIEAAIHDHQDFPGQIPTTPSHYFG